MSRTGNHGLRLARIVSRDGSDARRLTAGFFPDGTIQRPGAVPTAQWFGWKRFHGHPLAPAYSPAPQFLPCLESLESAAACSSQSGKRRIRETEAHRSQRSGRLSCASSDKRAKKQRIPCLSVRFRQPFHVAIERIKRTSGLYHHQDRIRDETPLLPAHYRRQDKLSLSLPHNLPDNTC